ncbi:hypothetical protein BGLA2_1040008 [Burkholderia gladioli]|nr:hypothetical protein BGLA2_1040008 [Burkholderia gladioli]
MSPSRRAPRTWRQGRGRFAALSVPSLGLPQGRFLHQHSLCTRVAGDRAARADRAALSRRRAQRCDLGLVSPAAARAELRGCRTRGIRRTGLEQAGTPLLVVRQQSSGNRRERRRHRALQVHPPDGCDARGRGQLRRPYPVQQDHGRNLDDLSRRRHAYGRDRHPGDQQRRGPEDLALHRLRHDLVDGDGHAGRGRSRRAALLLRVPRVPRGFAGLGRRHEHGRLFRRTARHRRRYPDLGKQDSSYEADPLRRRRRDHAIPSLLRAVLRTARGAGGSQRLSITSSFHLSAGDSPRAGAGCRRAFPAIIRPRHAGRPRTLSPSRSERWRAVVRLTP